jgi:hypothetical protein
MNVGRLIGCRGNRSNGTVIIDLQLEDGSTQSVHLTVPVASALLPTLHQVSTQVALAQGLNPAAMGMAQQFPVQTARLGYNAERKMSALVIDQGLPSQINFQLSEGITWQLAADVTSVLPMISGAPTEQKH